MTMRNEFCVALGRHYNRLLNSNYSASVAELNSFAVSINLTPHFNHLTADEWFISVSV